MRQHAAGAVEVGKRFTATQHSELVVGLDPEAHEGVVVEQAAAGPGVALGKAQYVGIEDGFTNAPEARLQPAAEEAAGGEHEVVRLEQLILPVLAVHPDHLVAVIAGAQHPLAGEEGAAKGHEAALERLLHPHADEGRRHGGHLLDGAAGAPFQLAQTRADQPQRQAGGQHDMATAGHAASLHHAADLAGQIRQQVLLARPLLVEQAGDVGGAKLVGIAAELGELGQANFPGQDAAVGKTGVGREIRRRERRVKIAKSLQGGEQDGVRGGGIGHAGASVGGEPSGFQGADGGQALVVVLLAHQGQPLFCAVALQVGQTPLDILHPHLAVRVIRMGRHEGGQGGAGIPVALQQIHRAGGEVQGALAGSHQQGLLARLGEAQGRREARHAAADHDAVKFHGCAPWWNWRCWHRAGRGARSPGGGPSTRQGRTAPRRSSR